MGFGASLLLIAAGAILAWAVNVDTSGVDLNAVGYILLAVGAVGAVLSLVFWSSWVGPGYFTRSRRTYIDDRPSGRRREIIEDDIV